MQKRYVSLLLTVLVATTMFSSLVAASPIDDFFNWLRSLFGMPYTIATVGCVAQPSRKLSTPGNPYTFICNFDKCTIDSVVCTVGGASSTTQGTELAKGGSITISCKSTTSGALLGTYSITVTEYVCTPYCGNGVVESNEICDTSKQYASGCTDCSLKYQTVTSMQGGCQGTVQQKSLCMADCMGWGGWSDVSGTFTQTYKCCGVSCSPTTAQCNPSCSGSLWCTYSSSVASCTPTCSNGVCGSCSAACGTPSCSLTKGQCGVSCSSNSDCTAKTTVCPEKCDGRKYVASVPSQSCYPTCVNGACTDCSSICPYVAGSYIVGKCGANCVADQACGNCGVNKCVDGILQGCQPQPSQCGSGYECK